jgi:hypothetical protein
MGAAFCALALLGTAATGVFGAGFGLGWAFAFEAAVGFGAGLASTSTFGLDAAAFFGACRGMLVEIAH